MATTAAKKNPGRRKFFQPHLIDRTAGAVVALVPYRFRDFRVSVTLADARGWYSLHAVENMTLFDLEHGQEARRYAYNQRSMLRAARTKRIVTAKLGGFTDLFVPVVRDGKVNEMLLAGPIRTHVPTSSELMASFRSMTGQTGHVGDPEFIRYVSSWLSTTLFDASQLEAFRRLLWCLARLMAGIGDAEELAGEITLLDQTLSRVSLVHRMWEIARDLIDSRTARIWTSHYRLLHLQALNILRAPEHAVVGLVASRPNESDAVDEIIRRHEFQRACVKMAYARSNMVAAPIGDHGVVLLPAPERTDARSRASLIDVSERAISLARRSRLALHTGVGTVGGNVRLPTRYQEALAAAEQALSQGSRSVHAAKTNVRADFAVRDLRAQLGRLASEPASSLRARFDRYADAVAAHSGYRLEPARAHLEAGMERIVEPLLETGVLDRKSFDEMYAALGRSAQSARTFVDLRSAYREAMAALEQSLSKPSDAHQERSLSRARAFVRDHLTEPMTRAEVAQVAGYAPNYFSFLFKQKEKMTFERFVTELRIERAKQMLARTSLSVARAGKLSGFSSSAYFCRVFKRVVGETPVAYKRRPS